jgi:hypothetical protein
MLLLAFVLLSASCKLSTPSNNQKESFSGTLDVLGHSEFYFNVKKTGEYQMKITAENPAVAIVGLGFGVPGAIGCSIYESNSYATLNLQALGDAITPGQYCGMISDVGALTTSMTYTVEVSHP